MDDILDSSQSDFRSYHSIEAALAKVLNTICLRNNAGSFTDSTAFDLSSIWYCGSLLNRKGRNCNQIPHTWYMQPSSMMVNEKELLWCKKSLKEWVLVLSHCTCAFCWVDTQTYLFLSNSLHHEFYSRKKEQHSLGTISTTWQLWLCWWHGALAPRGWTKTALLTSELGISLNINKDQANIISMKAHHSSRTST